MGWAVIVVALVVTTVAVTWLLGLGAAPGPVTAALAPSPTQTPGPTLRPTVVQTDQPTVEPTTSIEPTPEPTIEPTLEPTVSPVAGLSIVFPKDHDTISTRVINVIGNAPPGSTITRDIPMWFDDHTITRDDSIWMMSVQLGDGSNDLTFRIGDDRSTELHLTIVYQAPG